MSLGMCCRKSSIDYVVESDNKAIICAKIDTLNQINALCIYFEAVANYGYLNVCINGVNSHIIHNINTHNNYQRILYVYELFGYWVREFAITDKVVLRRIDTTIAIVQALAKSYYYVQMHEPVQMQEPVQMHEPVQIQEQDTMQESVQESVQIQDQKPFTIYNFLRGSFAPTAPL